MPQVRPRPTPIGRSAWAKTRARAGRGRAVGRGGQGAGAASGTRLQGAMEVFGGCVRANSRRWALLGRGPRRSWRVLRLPGHCHPRPISASAREQWTTASQEYHAAAPPPHPAQNRGGAEVVEACGDACDRLVIGPADAADGYQDGRAAAGAWPLRLSQFDLRERLRPRPELCSKLQIARSSAGWRAAAEEEDEEGWRRPPPTSSPVVQDFSARAALLGASCSPRPARALCARAATRHTAPRNVHSTAGAASPLAASSVCGAVRQQSGRVRAAAATTHHQRAVA